VILIDTSVWIDHFRISDERLVSLLEAGEVLGHPFVAGEIALGNFQQRDHIFWFLRRLPQAASASHAEVMHIIDREALFRRGIGYVDAHLLAAARLTPGSTLWTHDRRLHAVAAEPGLAAALSH
jgi:predicted nucleic acid-binding protein